MRKVGILGGDIPQSRFYAEAVPLLSQEMKNPDTHFYFTDQKGCATMAARYLMGQRFRSCTMLCTSETCRHSIGGYKTLKFSTISEAVAYLKTEMDMLIEL